VFRNTFSSPKQASTCGSISDPEVLKRLKEYEELKSTLKNYERYVAEIQGNLKVLTAERDKIFNLYEQAQEEVSRLRQEVIKCSSTPKNTVRAQAVLRHLEIERDTALSDFRRMATERDSLREQLKISQESAFREKAHLEQRIEDLETTVQNLDSERLEQMSKVALMKDCIDSLETEMKRLARRALDSETERSHQQAECVSLRLFNEKTEQSLLETEQNLVKKKYEMQLAQEKIRCLDEKIDNFSRQSLLQQEEICALKETVAQLHKEKATLQDYVEEGKEQIAFFEESLSVKEKIIADFKILISELEHSTKKSAEALCVREKDITSLHQQLQETSKELAQTNKNRESLAQENDRLQEHLSNIKQESQVLYRKIVKYENELDNMKLKAQDSNTDIVRLKGILKSKERENCELLENYHKACEQGESWEAKWHQAEADCSSVRLALISAEFENRRLKEKIESLETELGQLFYLLSCLFPLENLKNLNGNARHGFGNMLQTYKLPSGLGLLGVFVADHLCFLNIAQATEGYPCTLNTEEALNSCCKCESNHSEIEVLRKQLGNERASVKKNLESLIVSNCEKEFQLQKAKQEKDSEIQFLKEQLSSAESKLAVQSQDFTQLRNRAAQLELELGITKIRLETKCFERQVYVECAVQELRHQKHPIPYQLSSTLRTSSPERSHHRFPDRSPDGSLE
ncbi:Testis-specific 10, partial [Buceros rhinoceros silvestris]